ncbi:translation initiation factor IF-2 [Pelagibaculum spongiae]|uniref:Translation initiation factor IF-2 n=1 Tax=Pelagibaculum spongiae TaxID=2080658 RepID=A0A2V1H3I1_9GAMM|nr:translation initiation factor IF-2 [Pelagibaculum spongiae]PVZ71778.1 translation initiation factor IF-2 [Pelagibaculum spongiae]
MAEVTVKELAGTVNTPVDKLMVQLKDAGVTVNSADQRISDSEKQQLLSYLKQSHGEQTDAAPKKITLSRTKKTQLKVSGSTGGSKTVNVAVKKKRTYVSRAAAETEDQSRIAAELDAQRAAEETARKAAEDATAKVEQEKSAQKVAKEQAARLSAEKKAAQKAEAEAAALKSAEEQAARKTAETAARAEKQKATEQETARKVADKAKPQPTAGERQKPAPQDSGKAKLSNKPRQDTRNRSGGGLAEQGGEVRTTSTAKRKDVKKGGNTKSTANRRQGMAADDNSRRRGRRGGSRNRRGAQQDNEHGFTKPTAPVIHEVKIPETITVAELAQKMSVKAAEVIKHMMKLGAMATINQVIDQETATIVVEEMGHKPVSVNSNALEDDVLESIERSGDTANRAPVVTIMGHVDHGKTSLLDYIRRTRVQSGEAGGITQHIGAYHVETERGMVTFLDTPGHAAFTAMRARGANLTDIAILIVAADDGVMPQTIESVQHARAAGVPIIVAVNKVDKPEANADRVKTELSQHEVISEEWGGDTQFIEVSAKEGTGIDKLLEAIIDESELLELNAVANCPAQGVVVEARLDKGRGVVATVLVQNGTLRKGDMVLCGREYGRVRALLDENGKPVETAGPSIPVEVLGLSGAPNAGDEVTMVPNERKAKEIALFRQGKFRDVKLARQQKSKLENMFSNMQEGEVSTVNVVLKTDVQGSLEAITESLAKLSTDEVRVSVISSAVGGITETDVNLAAASNALVIGFNVRADATARRIVAEEAIELRYYSVIYHLIDEVKQAMSGMLAPEFREDIVGLAQVRSIFRSPKFGAVAGCMVLEGTVKRNERIRVLRDSVVIYEGELESLRRFKDDVNEVRNGTECGIAVKNYNDVKEGDQIEVYEQIAVQRQL